VLVLGAIKKELIREGFLREFILKLPIVSFPENSQNSGYGGVILVYLGSFSFCIDSSMFYNFCSQNREENHF